MPKHNIVLLTLDYPPERGGVSRYLGNLVAHSNGKIRVIVESRHETEGPGSVKAEKFFQRPWPKWWPIVAICRELDRKTDRVLVSHVFPVGTAAWISRRFWGPEYSIILHGLDVRLARTAWKRWLFRCICRRAHSVLANSQATKDDALKITGAMNISVVTPGVEKSELPSRADARKILNVDLDEMIVLSVARLVPRKGIDMALAAMGRIQHAQHVRYVVLGDGPDRVRLQFAAKEARTNVDWLRNATDDEKWLWLAAADVFLLPVRDEGTDVEGFGIVFLEAAQAGMPSVAGNSGGASEAVRHERTGLLVDPKDVGEIERVVKQLLDDPQLRQKMGEEARQRAETDFQWQERADTVLRLIES